MEAAASDAAASFRRASDQKAQRRQAGHFSEATEGMEEAEREKKGTSRWKKEKKGKKN